MRTLVSIIGRMRGQDGQGLVEMSVVLPVFLLVLVGVFDGGRAVYTNSTLSQAVREGARLAATEAPWVGLDSNGCVADANAIGSGNPGAHVCPVDVASFKSHIVKAVNRMAVSLGPLTAVHISCNAGDSSDPVPTGEWTESSGGNGCEDGSGNPITATGEHVSVRVEFTYQPLTPIVNSLIGALPLSSTATMVIN